MTWVKLDDGFWANPKIDSTSLPAVGVYARSLSYCGNHLTDGRITESAALYMAKGKKALITELVSMGLWHKNGAGYVIPDFCEFNPTKEETEKIRQARSEAGKRGGVASGKVRSK